MHIFRSPAQAYDPDCLHITLKQGSGYGMIWAVISGSFAGLIITLKGRIIGEKGLAIRNPYPPSASLPELSQYLHKECDDEYVPPDEDAIPNFPVQCSSRKTTSEYVPSKPDKFGMKFWLATDVDSKYTLNGFPYMGKNEEGPENSSLSEYVVLHLIEPFKNNGGNITTNNFFTTLNLSQMLKRKNTTLNWNDETKLVD
ncbi:piggyBac transposable element-derived protein 4 [Trichonephila clavipes]|nr:piggyBac transposable element-derived protein 4 [Trichonephila clavipes]